MGAAHLGSVRRCTWAPFIIVSYVISSYVSRCYDGAEHYDEEVRTKGGRRTKRRTSDGGADTAETGDEAGGSRVRVGRRSTRNQSPGPGTGNRETRKDCEVCDVPAVPVGEAGRSASADAQIMVI